MRSRTLLLISLIAGVAAALACGDVTGPSQPPLTIAVALTSRDGPFTSLDSAGRPVITCGVHLTATSTGVGTASWSGATLRFYVGASTTPVDSVTVSASDIQQAWTSGSISTGQSQTSQWRLSANVPFSADLAFAYRRSTGETASTVVHFACTLPVDANAAPPTITALSVTPPSGNLPMGAPLTVSYTASAPAGGLWQTAVHITGPCEVSQYFSESLAPTVTHSLSIVLPPTCQLGVPIHLSVVAQDAAARTTSSDPTTTLVLSDAQPPVVHLGFFAPRTGVLVQSPSGTYFAGDTLKMELLASDNHALAEAVWEVLPYGVKDSVPLSGAGAGLQVSIPLHRDWTQPFQIRATARDASGNVSAPVTTSADSVRILPTVDRTTRVGTIAAQVIDVAVDGARGVAYAVQGDKKISVVSLANMTVTGTLALPAEPLDVDLTSGGDSLIIALAGAGSLGIIDLRVPTLALSLLPLTALDSARGQAVFHARALRNGHVMLAIMGSQASDASLLDVDLATNTERTRTDAAVQGPIGSVIFERSLDGAVLGMNQGDQGCMRRYDTGTDGFSACAPAKVRYWKPTVDGTGLHIANSLDVYDAGMQKLPQQGFQFTIGVPYTLLSADGQSLFEMLWIPGIIRRNAADGTVLDRTVMPVQMNAPARLSNDGHTLVLIERGNESSRLAMIDLR